MIPREEVALYVRGYLEDEQMHRTLSAFNQECKLRLPEPLEKKLSTVLAEHRDACGSGDDLDMPQLWKRVDVLLGHLRFMTMPRPATSARSQHYRSKRGNSILHDQRRGVQPFTVMPQHADKDAQQRWQQQARSPAPAHSLAAASNQLTTTASPQEQQHADHSDTPPPSVLPHAMDYPPLMSVGEDTAQLLLSSSDGQRADYGAAAPPAASAVSAGHLRSPRRKSMRPRRKQPLTESPIKDRLRKPTSAEHLVETILSTPSLQLKLANEINHHHLTGSGLLSEVESSSASPGQLDDHAYGGVDSRAGDVGLATTDTPPTAAGAADVSEASVGDLPAPPTGQQLDASADDTVSRVLEWMHNDPAFGDLPWSELEPRGTTTAAAATTSSAIGNNIGHSKPGDVQSSLLSSVANPINPLLLTPSKMMTIADTVPTFSTFEYSPSVISQVLSSISTVPDAAAASVEDHTGRTAGAGGVRIDLGHLPSSTPCTSSSLYPDRTCNMVATSICNSSSKITSVTTAASAARSTAASLGEHPSIDFAASGGQANGIAPSQSTAISSSSHNSVGSVDRFSSLAPGADRLASDYPNRRAHVRSLDFSSAPPAVSPASSSPPPLVSGVVAAANIASFVQSTVFAVLPPQDSSPVRNVLRPAAAVALDERLSSSTTAAASSSRPQPAPDLSVSQSVAMASISGSSSSRSDEPPKKKKKKKKSKQQHDELEAFPANVDVDGFLSQLSYD
ncbi:polycystin-1-like protein 3 isoform X2 [Sycon ciliatum]|uniref:polycystin-1-like protein 3 isoform X2 n=1 Tax=Sycon ciliatum TaxID=27933 RepID=UPI0031F63E01